MDYLRNMFKGSASKTRRGRRNFITHKGDKDYNAKGHRQTKGKKPYTRRVKKTKTRRDKKTKTRRGKKSYSRRVKIGGQCGMPVAF